MTQHLSAENISDFCHGDLFCEPDKPYLRSKCTGLLQNLTQWMAQHEGDHLIGLHLLVPVCTQTALTTATETENCI